MSIKFPQNFFLVCYSVWLKTDPLQNRMEKTLSQIFIRNLSECWEILFKCIHFRFYIWISIKFEWFKILHWKYILSLMDVDELVTFEIFVKSWKSSRRNYKLRWNSRPRQISAHRARTLGPRSTNEGKTECWKVLI